MRLPPRSSWDAEDTIPVDTEVESGPLTTFFGPLVDLTVDDVPEVDTSHLGATMSMLQEVLRSVESLAVPSGSGGVPSSMLAGGTLALVDVTKADEVGALEPQIVKNAKGPMLELPSEFEFRRAIQSFQDLYDRAQRNARALQERNDSMQRLAQLEQECSHLTESLKVHEEATKSFAVERRDHEVLQEKLESRYKSLNKKYQELKRKEAIASS
ncbi:uncharacterized protein [Setaria viridis]|uniref:Uncharacterized protein n=1 Tax=Setaria viridis TaxID=4556 RepID=A0A4V6D6H8_SETVI|nr:uncharacterized protein LOC117855780 isoform X4 [Setaria viridis]TKW14466.1 hypothetical protein SEVIR_5G170100v2 [Setaria viridis]TKW14467.1 hypothetical protein SEVIR_5G170100v2 [Setaria viridis]